MKRILLVLCVVLVASFSLMAQDFSAYGGKQSCVGCHSSKIDFAAFEKSGHPWKVQKIDTSKIVGGVYKPFPTGTNTAGVPLAPEVLAAGYTYKDSIGFMIGGYGWKARWMNKNAYIYEGTKAQYNLGYLDNKIDPTLTGHGAYNSTNVTAVIGLKSPSPSLYTCGTCHTTGWIKYDATTSPYRKDNLPGFDGTFYEYGVQCEGCHGPAKYPHTPTPTKDGFNMCKNCHARGSGTRIPVKSGGEFLDHREQVDQMTFTKHYRNVKMTCVSCHDPHKSSVWDLGGLKSAAKTCSPCHSNKTVDIKKVVSGVTTPVPHECRDCHMPYIGNTAVKQNNNRGDQASHMWKINTAAVGKVTGMWSSTSAANVTIPADSVVAHTLDFACLGCHTTKSLTWASGYATGIHTKSIVVNVEGPDAQIPSAFSLAQNYPNPFNPTTMISFGLPQASEVSLIVYNAVGQEIKVLANGRYPAGSHNLSWNGKDANGQSVASGVYLYKLVTDSWMQTKKMMLMK